MHSILGAKPMAALKRWPQRTAQGYDNAQTAYLLGQTYLGILFDIGECNTCCISFFFEEHSPRSLELEYRGV